MVMPINRSSTVPKPLSATDYNIPDISPPAIKIDLIKIGDEKLEFTSGRSDSLTVLVDTSSAQFGTAVKEAPHKYVSPSFD